MDDYLSLGFTLSQFIKSCSDKKLSYSIGSSFIEVSRNSERVMRYDLGGTELCALHLANAHRYLALALPVDFRRTLDTESPVI